MSLFSMMKEVKNSGRLVVNEKHCRVDFGGGSMEIREIRSFGSDADNERIKNSSSDISSRIYAVWMRGYVYNVELRLAARIQTLQIAVICVLSSS